MRYYELIENHGPKEDDSLCDFIHFERTPETLDEAPRGSAVRKDEVPRQYRKLPLLGRGMTALVFEKDPHTALIFTRDQMKVEYLRDTGLARVIDSYEVRGYNPVPGMSDFDIYILEMPKLHKLAGRNVTLVRKAMKEYDTVFHEKMRENGGMYRGGDRARQDAVRDAVQHFSGDENHMLEPLWSFLINYDASQFYMDLGTRNFLQDDEGKIYCVDPIASKEILNMIDDHRKAEYSRKEDERRYGRRW